MHDCTFKALARTLSNSKFVIDGEIEGKPELVYSLEQTPEKLTKTAINLKGLRILSLSLVIVSSILFFKFCALTTKIAKAETLINQNYTYKIANDTLKRKVAQLIKDNEILSENNDSAAGVFFEVQIGNFKNFNLDAYLSELQALRQEKTGNSSRLCLGRFRSFSKATLFEKDIEKMGFPEAFLIGRIDGKLVNYQEALAACQKTTKSY